MLVLTRKKDETVRAELDEDTLSALLDQVRRTKVSVAIEVSVIKIRGNAVQLGFSAPPSVRLVRGELETHEQEDDDARTDGDNVPSQSGAGDVSDRR